LAKKKLIVDTNLLLLLVIGRVDDGRFIKRSDRLNKFNENDYQILLRFILRYDIFITHYIATEVSNLIDLHGPARIKAFEVARILFSSFKQVETSIQDDSAEAFFEKYGLTDSSLIRLVSDYNVITDDNRLSEFLYRVEHKNVIPYYTLRAAIF